MFKRRPHIRLSVECLEPKAMLAATPSVDFIAGGPSGEQVYGIAADSAGNLYLSGLFAGTTDLDAGPGITSLTSNGDSDIFVVKYDASRAVVWARQFGGAGHDRADKISVDRDGNTYVAGEIQGAVAFDAQTLTQSGGYIARLDPSGTVTWARSLGGTRSDFALDDRAASPADHSLYSVSGGSLARLSAATGATQWTKNTTATFSGVALDEAGTGALVLSGSFTTKAMLGSITVTGKKNDTDALVAKSDLDGNFLWAKSIATNTSQLAQAGPVATAGGDIYVAGKFAVSAKFGAFTLNSVGWQFNDQFIAKFDGNGNVRWAQAILELEPNSVYTSIADIAVSDAGNVFVAGQFQSTARFGSEVLEATYFSTGTQPSRSPDGFVSELNAATGQFVKSWRFGGASMDLAAAIASDASGGVLVAGYVNRTNGSLSFTADFPDGTTHTSTSTDVAVLRFSMSAAPSAALVHVAMRTDDVPRRLLTSQSRRAVRPIPHHFTTFNALAVDGVMSLYAHRQARHREDR